MNVKNLIERLSEYPEDTEIKIASSTLSQNDSINSIVVTQDTNGNLKSPVILSAYYYGATNGEY